jgi:hypothetical protein
LTPLRNFAHWTWPNQKHRVTALITTRNKTWEAAAVNENKVPLEVHIK